MLIRTLASLAAALTLSALATSPAPAQNATQVGRLSCDVSAGVGMILMQKQTMRCMFIPAAGGPPEPYLGRIDEYGVALGAVGQGHLIWGVFAPASGLPMGRSRELTAGSARRRPPASGSEPTPLSAARGGRSPCSPFRSKGRSASMSQAGSRP